jgi:hypothetical protein
MQGQRGIKPLWPEEKIQENKMSIFCGYAVGQVDTSDAAKVNQVVNALQDEEKQDPPGTFVNAGRRGKKFYAQPDADGHCLVTWEKKVGKPTTCAFAEVKYRVASPPFNPPADMIQTVFKQQLAFLRTIADHVPALGAGCLSGCSLWSSWSTIEFRLKHSDDHILIAALLRKIADRLIVDQSGNYALKPLSQAGKRVAA